MKVGYLLTLVAQHVGMSNGKNLRGIVVKSSFHRDKYAKSKILDFLKLIISMRGELI